jgi:hypothetical protein
MPFEYEITLAARSKVGITWKGTSYHRKTVIKIIYDCDCKLLEVREDAWTGDVNGVSNTFLVQKGFSGS